MMRQCGYCGDNVPDEGHIADCWAFAKITTQEKLDAPVPSDFASARDVETDATWKAAHPANP